MSIWFGWSRSQATPLVTENEGVDDASARPPDVSGQAASSTPGALDALRDVASRAGIATPAPDTAVLEIWELHRRVVEGERKANRFLATPGARREHNEALVAEAAALHKLGYQTFDVFAAAHRAVPRDAPPATTGPRQTVDRIRVLLGELGVEPGDDPLISAKTFLSRVEGDDLTPAAHRVAAIGARCRAAAIIG